ncbi:hypothetical protein C8J56DRAFT_1129362 [Mycena floridula]|nr:hypothetical protein C8J56DRAFT_1129362 [Mycena floridula]
MALPSVNQLPLHLLDHTYGAELMAAFGATALYGIQCLQVFIYYNIYSNDAFYLKVLVAWTWVMATVHESLIISMEYSLLIRHFGDVAPIFVINREVITQAIFTILISIPTQLFFLNRIYKLSGNKAALPIFLIICMILQLGKASFSTKGHSESEMKMQGLAWCTSVGGEPNTIGVVYIVSAAFIDVSIAASMVYLLRSAQVHGMSQTRRMITRLIFFSVNTGIWTALLAVFCAMAMIVYPTTYIFIALYLPISSVYANTLLANLNVREYVRGRPDIISLSRIVARGIQGDSTGGNTLHFNHQNTSGLTSGIEVGTSTGDDVENLSKINSGSAI